MAIIDVFTYNGGADILEIRLNILSKYVDQFIIVEAPTTFSGLAKPLYYEEQKDRFKKWAKKIKYFVINEDYTFEEVKLATESPNTHGAKHWVHEFLQKESIKKALTHLKGFDAVFIGDVDEIWNPQVSYLLPAVRKMPLNVYTYYLNNKSSEVFSGTILCLYMDVKDTCLNHLRTSSPTGYYPPGWHFTSMGGYKEVRRKLENSYTEDSYATPWVMGMLETNINENRDFLGRSFTYTIDESEWPEYLKKNKKKYKHLLK